MSHLPITVPAANPQEGSQLEPILFYSKTTGYSELSNFAPFGFEDGGVTWPTVEHYFQAQKFPRAEHVEYRNKIRKAKSPKLAQALGTSRRVPIRPDWSDVRDAIMLTALRKKFALSPMRELLLGTGERPLVEASPVDSYWGLGKKGTGENRLGKLLMQVRGELATHK